MKIHLRFYETAPVLPKADGRQSKFLVRETRTRNLVQEICIQVASKFLVRETWPMTETIKNFKFYFFPDSNL